MHKISGRCACEGRKCLYLPDLTRFHASVGLDVAGDGVGAEKASNAEAEAVDAHGTVDAGHG